MTLYARIGDFFVYLCIAALVALTAAAFLRRTPATLGASESIPA
jgi:hypothetical protein